MDIYNKDSKIELEHIYFTDFGKVIDLAKPRLKKHKVSFEYLKLIKGDKEIINKAFLNELDEQILRSDG